MTLLPLTAAASGHISVARVAGHLIAKVDHCVLSFFVCLVFGMYQDDWTQSTDAEQHSIPCLRLGSCVHLF